jgi:hypothetical protein
MANLTWTSTQYSNPDPWQIGERLDCAVRAIAIAMDIPYANAHALLREHGRKPKHRTAVIAVTNLIAQHRPTAKLTYHRPSRITVARFAKLNAKGRYVIFIRGHFFAIVDGTVHSFKGHEKARVLWAWNITSSSTCSSEVYESAALAATCKI